MTINEASRIYLGGLEADAVYLGATLVWEPASTVAWGPNESLYPAANATVGDAPSVLSLGSRIGILADGRITHIRYWRAANMLPSRTAAIWNDAGALLFSTITTGVPGWNLVPVEPALAVSEGDIIRVTYGYAGSGSDGSFGFSSSPSVYADTANLDFLSGCYVPGSSTGFPSTIPGDSSNYFADIVYQQKLATTPPWVPTDIAGLAVWHDAADLGLADSASVTSWLNKGSANQPAIVGTPPIYKTGVAPSGLPVVRFSPASRLRGNNASIYSPGIPMKHTWTVIYVSRAIGPVRGRCFTAPYPEGENVLIGYHTSGYDCMHQPGGWMKNPTGWVDTLPIPWKLYSATDQESVGVHFYIDGVDQTGLAVVSAGLNYYYNINGYSLTGTEEAGDFDIAELLIYDRALPDAERVQVEDYLRAKWGLP
jgi:Domain of unknown function (DUF4082)